MLQTIEILLILGLIAWQGYIFFLNGRLIRRVRAMYPGVGQLGVENRMVAGTGYDALTVAAPSPEFGEVITDTNDYLQANKGAAADFNALRDISEREAELLDAEIEAQISTPLYLGLLGTFGGAILGLFALVNPFGAAPTAAGTSFDQTDVTPLPGRGADCDGWQPVWAGLHAGRQPAPEGRPRHPRPAQE